MLLFTEDDQMLLKLPMHHKLHNFPLYVCHRITWRNGLQTPNLRAPKHGGRARRKRGVHRLVLRSKPHPLINNYHSPVDVPRSSLHLADKTNNEQVHSLHIGFFIFLVLDVYILYDCGVGARVPGHAWPNLHHPKLRTSLHGTAGRSESVFPITF